MIYRLWKRRWQHPNKIHLPKHHSINYTNRYPSSLHTYIKQNEVNVKEREKVKALLHIKGNYSIKQADQTAG